MHVIKKILLAIMPFSGWICLFLNVPFFLPIMANSSFSFIGFLLLNYVVFKLSLSLSVVLHECGHWIAARHLDELDKQDLQVYQRVFAKINTSPYIKCQAILERVKPAKRCVGNMGQL